MSSPPLLALRAAARRLGYSSAPRLLPPSSSPPSRSSSSALASTCSSSSSRKRPLLTATNSLCCSQHGRPPSTSPLLPPLLLLHPQRRGFASGSGGKGGDPPAPALTPTSTATTRGHGKEEEKGDADDKEDKGPGPLSPGQRPGAAAIPGVYHADRRLAIVYTCKVCETRAVKAFSKQAYDHGVVIVRCPGCDNLHLVADRLGWFEDGGAWDIARVLEAQGERVVAVNDDNVLSLTPRDLVGQGQGQSGGKKGDPSS